MTAIIKVIDEDTNRLIGSEYRLAPVDVHENQLSIRYDFHFCINVAKPLFNPKKGGLT